jgi:hypothetical protein
MASGVGFARRKVRRPQQPSEESADFNFTVAKTEQSWSALLQ